MPPVSSHGGKKEKIAGSRAQGEMGGGKSSELDRKGDSAKWETRVIKTSLIRKKSWLWTGRFNPEGEKEGNPTTGTGLNRTFK